MRSPTAAALLLAALAGCASGSPQGLLRVDLPGPGSGPGSPDERGLSVAVRDAATAEGLACQPGTSADLLRCAPAAVGNEGRGLVVVLERAGTGYSLSIHQSLNLFGGPSPVCEVQRRMADRIDGALLAPVTRVDGRSDCGKQ
jgi:hypothetical protein